MPNFSYYADAFSEIGSTGLEPGLVLDGLEALIGDIDTVTYGVFGQDRQRTIDAVKARNDLKTEMNRIRNDLGYDNIKETYFLDPFRALIQWTEEVSGKKINDYLSDGAIKVTQTFADMAGAVGISIAIGNIA